VTSALIRWRQHIKKFENYPLSKILNFSTIVIKGRWRGDWGYDLCLEAVARRALKGMPGTRLKMINGEISDGHHCTNRLSSKTCQSST